METRYHMRTNDGRAIETAFTPEGMARLTDLRHSRPDLFAHQRITEIIQAHPSDVAVNMLFVLNSKPIQYQPAEPFVYMELASGVFYWITTDGFILYRSNLTDHYGYTTNWRILGFRPKHNARSLNTIKEVLYDPKRLGAGIVEDLDHGTRRQWGDRAIKLTPHRELPISIRSRVQIPKMEAA